MEPTVRVDRLRHHAMHMIGNRLEFERQPLESGAHIDWLGTDIAEHQSDKRLLHRIGSSCELGLQRFDRYMSIVFAPAA